MEPIDPRVVAKLFDAANQNLTGEARENAILQIRSKFLGTENEIIFQQNLSKGTDLSTTPEP